MNWARASPPPVSTVESGESTQSWVSAGSRSGSWRLNSPYWSNIVGAQCRARGPRMPHRILRPCPRPRRSAAPPAAPATPDMPAGCGLPGVVKDGRLKTAANIDASWIDAPAQQLLADRLGRPCVIVNDADAAGIAEMAFGAARGRA